MTRRKAVTAVLHITGISASVLAFAALGCVHARTSGSVTPESLFAACGIIALTGGIGLAYAIHRFASEEHFDETKDR